MKHRNLVLFGGIILGLFTNVIAHASPRARTPAKTVLKDAVVRLSAGANHVCQVKNDGTVRCWGSNVSGQLGDGTTNNPFEPVTSGVPFPSVADAAGDNHSCALLASGGVTCWGDNNFGQLGDTTTTRRPAPVFVNGLPAAVAITAGSFHTCALLANGTARCWGRNFNGQLGNGVSGNMFAPTTTPVLVLTTPSTPLSNIVALSAGANHTCALLANGAAHC